MDVAFVCAMPMEAAPLIKRLDLRQTELGGRPAHRGALDGRSVCAIVTGMGTALAATGTERLLDAEQVQRVVVVGITGAVDDTTPIGTVVNPETVVDSATGTAYRPEPIGLGPPSGMMWTGDVLLTDPEVIAGLRSRGVVCLDMETAAIARVCEERQVPWSVVRAISDRATDGTVDEELFRLSDQEGRPKPAAVARYLVKHPGRIPRLARMAREAKRATETAADTAIRLCS